MYRWLGVVVVALLLAGCPRDVTQSPVPQEDVLVVGRLLAMTPAPQEPAVVHVEVRLGVPEALKPAMRREGRPIPEAEKEVTAKVRVDRSSVCVVDGEPGELSRLRVGQEVVIVPVSGSCAMVGTKVLLADAAEVYDFRSYQVRFLPKSLESLPSWVTDRTDPRAINSSGKEVTPVPVGDGRVLYFSAGLLPPVREGDPPRGPLRPGMRASQALSPWAAQGGVRPYRTEFQGDRWSPPLPVRLPGLPEDAWVRVTWVSPAEDWLLAEVRTADQPPRLMESRKDPRGEWMPLAEVKEAAGRAAGDGQRFGSSLAALVWTVYDVSSSDLWLKLQGQAGQPLEPRINTLGSEWAPRVGPNTTLYFCRGDRQLLFARQTVAEVRLPGSQRLPLTEAAPTADGRLLFYRLPRYTPVELDWDLYVSRWEQDQWGPPTPVDTFRFP
ncbi:MAG: hypothetical protein N2447_08900 [Thermoanaerobaculum sp.]|nr:hypothetical protein [Thermoanaerobaculum sp.]